MNNWLTTPTALLILLIIITICYIIIDDFRENIQKSNGKLSEHRPTIYKIFAPFINLFPIESSVIQETFLTPKDKELDNIIRQSGYYLTIRDIYRTQKAGVILGLLVGCFTGLLLFQDINRSQAPTPLPNTGKIQKSNKNTLQTSSLTKNKNIQKSSTVRKQKARNSNKFPYLKYLFPVIIVFFMVLGYELPIDAVRKQAKYRSKAILKELPFAIDLLAAAMDVGHTFNDAVRNLLETQGKSILNDELSTFLKDVEMGKTSAEALLDLDRRIAVREFTRFAHAIVYAMENGSSVIDILKVQVEEIRREKMTSALVKIEEIETQMVLPLWGLSLCVVILIVASVLIHFEQLGTS